LKPLVLSKKIKTNVKQSDNLALDVQISDSIVGDNDRMTLRKIFSDPINQLVLFIFYIDSRSTLKNATSFVKISLRMLRKLRRQW